MIGLVAWQPRPRRPRLPALLFACLAAAGLFAAAVFLLTGALHG